MDRKLTLLIVGFAAMCCHLSSSAPTAVKHNFASSREGRDYMSRYLESFEPLAISKREAPVYDQEQEQPKNQEKDLKPSATGYGYGHGGSGGYGHGGSSSPTGYVSYGAKTGGYGAFSWYSDHPAGTYGYH